MKIINKDLSGAEMLNFLRKGHLVRRACWVDGVYIRITNERGFDDDGNAVFSETDSIYTLCSGGYFLHLGFSDQPFRHPRTYLDSYDKHQCSTRDGEGIGMLFADDWEEYGFMSRKDFKLYIEEVQDEVRENKRIAKETAIEKAQAQND